MRGRLRVLIRSKPPYGPVRNDGFQNPTPKAHRTNSGFPFPVKVDRGGVWKCWYFSYRGYRENPARALIKNLRKEGTSMFKSFLNSVASTVGIIVGIAVGIPIAAVILFSIEAYIKG
jgi:hypothetical protein